MFQVPYEVLLPWFQACGYTPSPEQEAVHRALSYAEQEQDQDVDEPSVVIIGGGEQSGKSFLVGHHAFARWALDPIIWLVGERYADCEKEFQYIRDAALVSGMDSAGLLIDYSKGQDYSQPMSITFKCPCPDTPHLHGHTIKTLSSGDATKLAREAPDGIVMCEPGRQSYNAFRYLLRRATPHSAWFAVAGTFEEDADGWFADIWLTCQNPDNSYNGHAVSLPTYANRSNYPLGQEDPKWHNTLRLLEETAPSQQEAEEEINERLLGIPRKPHGLVFSDFGQEVHVSDMAEYEPEVEVHLAIDPGWEPSAYAVLFCQFHGAQIIVFDEIYVNRMRTAEIIDLVLNHPAFPDITTVWFDPFAWKQHSQGQDSTLESWQAALGGRLALRAPLRNFSEFDGRQRVHDKLAINPLNRQPYVLCAPRCRNLIWEFTKGYRKRQHQDGSWANEPVDRNNHAIKALTYLIMGKFGGTDLRAPETRKPRPRTQLPAFMTAFRREPVYGSGRGGPFR